ncbi:ribonuclease Z [Bacillus sp. 2205SS5-2]|uniref:ribonuclease Z n=1 Tax=Bacillus sp. 2205SS5-2 TaxID=3109031 RepID=UPI0030042780
MELLFLGTGAGVPAKLRNVSSVALKLLQERGVVWLFDCGEATQHQILHTRLKPRRIEKIFITHLHGDHIYGLPGLLGSRSFQGGEGKLTVYGPKGLKEFISVALSISKTHLKYPLEVIEIEEEMVFEDEDFLVTAKKLDHAIETYGYRIEEKERKGPLLVDKLKKSGFMPGPYYRELKEGKTVILEDGAILEGKDFLGESQKGRIVSILGDTRPCLAAVELTMDADVLVHEATFADGNEEMAWEYYHSTVSQAIHTASQANARKLILTHISSRYTEVDAQQLESDAKTLFENTVLAQDFLEVEIPFRLVEKE